MWLSLLSVLANKRQAVWDADLKAVRGGSAVGQTGLLLGDPLFSKELENMGRQLAGRHYFCVVWHFCVCCICVCQPLMIIIAGKSDQMEFGEVKHARSHAVCGSRPKNALLSMWSSLPLRLNREKRTSFSGIQHKSHFSPGMASVPHFQNGLFLWPCLIYLMSEWLRDSPYVGIRLEPGTEYQIVLLCLRIAGSLQKADANCRRSVGVNNTPGSAFVSFRRPSFLLTSHFYQYL